MADVSAPTPGNDSPVDKYPLPEDYPYAPPKTEYLAERAEPGWVPEGSTPLSPDLAPDTSPGGAGAGGGVDPLLVAGLTPDAAVVVGEIIDRLELLAQISNAAAPTSSPTPGAAPAPTPTIPDTRLPDGTTYVDQRLLWASPATVARHLGLDLSTMSLPMQHVFLDTIREASAMLAHALNGAPRPGSTDGAGTYGPARCLAATYRIRARSSLSASASRDVLLRLVPPVTDEIVAVKVHADGCALPPAPPAFDPGPFSALAFSAHAFDVPRISGSSAANAAQVIDPFSGDRLTCFCAERPDLLRICLPPNLGSLADACGCSGGSSTGCMSSGPALVTVLYRVAENLPRGTSRILAQLVTALDPRFSDPNTCSVPLPDNVTSVSRQGVSWNTGPSTTITPAPAPIAVAGMPDEVAAWAAGYASAAAGRVRLSDPLVAKPFRTITVPCGPMPLPALEPVTATPAPATP